MKNFFKKLKSNKGFAMLFTVLIISIILAIGLGISDTTFKQTILSSLASDSQLAFYQADSGVECGMYYESKGIFSADTTIDGSSGSAISQLSCGDNIMSLSASDSRTGYIVYKENVDNNTPCYSITFDGVTNAASTTVSSRGYSSCTTSPRQVERGLAVTFANPAASTDSAPSGDTPADPNLPDNSPQ